MIYQWKEGAVAGIDAQTAGAEMERIRVRQNGRLESTDLVREARPESSPLHPAFEWDDAAAADKWRVEQAGYLIRHIQVVLERGDETLATRAFVSVKRDEDRSYTSTLDALADPELRGQVVRQAFMELEAWRKRHAELVEFARIFAEIDKARGAE